MPSSEPSGRFLPGTRIEVLAPPPLGRVRHAVFDFDGTLSMIRDGWQDQMVPMMVDVLAEIASGESREALEAVVIDFVDHLTGKQTIYQMLRLAEEVEKRGGAPRPPLEYKAIYNRRLQPLADERKSRVLSGDLPPDALMVPGSRRLLALLRERGVRLYLASGTDVEFVKEEARVLAIDHFFDGGIFGALPNYQDFSKEKVIRGILEGFALSGPELLVLGDGYVEIENGRRVGAVSVGLVSVESNRYHMNADKRLRLVNAGAHLILEPDLTEAETLVEYLRIPR
jgi:phosphoglycolate phosphatase-like HAD superfamily hydrolase